MKRYKVSLVISDQYDNDNPVTSSIQDIKDAIKEGLNAQEFDIEEIQIEKLK